MSPRLKARQFLVPAETQKISVSTPIMTVVARCIKVVRAFDPELNPWLLRDSSTGQTAANPM
jgi:hypothetical protein